ncbi:MAG: pyruvate kinase [Candidatus Micrarchaeia archaeon]
MASTKLICTIGPASSGKKAIRALARAGMTAARINTAFGNPAEWKAILEAVRESCGVPVIFDLKGPDTRMMAETERDIKKGEIVSVGFAKGHGGGFYFNRDISGQISAGDVLVVNGGLVKFKAVGKSKGEAQLRALNPGFLKNAGSVHSLSREFDLPAISEQDMKVIALAKKEGEKVFALSMARSSKDVLELRRLAGESTIISKIESRTGVANADGLIESSDAIMIARGDLGIELPMQKVPLVQKSIIRKCLAAGKASIVATQMLESMMGSPVPARADVSDIANAIMDGADCLMLSGETATGKYPALAAATMAKIADEIERSSMQRQAAGLIPDGSGNYSEIICNCVREMATSTGVTKIITPTRSGFTPRMVSRFRIGKPIYALTESAAVAKSLQFYAGVTPVLVKKEPKTPEECVGEAAAHGLIAKNDVLAVTLGQFSNKPATNTIYYIDIGNSEFRGIASKTPKGR